MSKEGYGEGAQTIILVPGLDGTALLFYRQIPLLAEEFNVVAFPIPTKTNTSMDALVEDLRQLLDELGVEQAFFCGESFGGALSMSFALAYPERVAGLVIVNSFPYIRQRLRLMLAPPLLKIIPWGAMRVVRRFTESRLHTPHTSREDLEEFHRRTREIDRDGYIQRLQILRSFDIRERLSEISAPVLFLAGDRDKLVPAKKEAEFMAERVPVTRVVILEGYGHICLINHDLNLLDYVREWQAEVGSAGGL